MRAALRVGLLAIAAVGAGCQTPIGNYFANRARDFGECFHATAGAGGVVAIEVKALGLAHNHVPFGVGSYWLCGWDYGLPRPRRGEDFSPTGVVLSGGLPLSLLRGVAHLEWSAHVNNGGAGHECFGLLPCLLARLSNPGTLKGAPRGPWLWSEEAWMRDRWTHVHIFDIEIGLSVLPLSARLGFSPGEFVDFLLGWVGIDIAGDDRPFVPAADGR